MTRLAPKRLAARQAGHDGRCPMCGALILGYDGRRTPTEAQLADEPAHPLDTLDLIAKVDGRWVHADCAATLGYEVVE